MNDKLRNILKAANKETEVFKTSDGSEVLMMSFGGRVLGLFAPGSDENFYWTNTFFISIFNNFKNIWFMFPFCRNS